MKIGFKADNYQEDVYIEINDTDEDKLFLAKFIAKIKSGDKKDFDQLISIINKKEK